MFVWTSRMGIDYLQYETIRVPWMIRTVWGNPSDSRHPTSVSLSTRVWRIISNHRRPKTYSTTTEWNLENKFLKPFTRLHLLAFQLQIPHCFAFEMWRPMWGRALYAPSYSVIYSLCQLLKLLTSVYHSSNNRCHSARKISTAF